MVGGDGQRAGYRHAILAAVSRQLSHVLLGLLLALGAVQRPDTSLGPARSAYHTLEDIRRHGVGYEMRDRERPPGRSWMRACGPKRPVARYSVALRIFSSYVLYHRPPPLASAYVPGIEFPV